MKPYEVKGLRQEKINIPKQKLPKPPTTVQEEVAKFRTKRIRDRRGSGNGKRYYAKRMRQVARHTQNLI